MPRSSTATPSPAEPGPRNPRGDAHPPVCSPSPLTAREASAQRPRSPRPRKCPPSGGRKESADKPGSVVDSHSSGMRVTAQLKRPTRKPMWAHVAAHSTARFPIWSCSRWGLPCRECCHSRGALLPHHFTLTVAACAALRRYLSVALSVGSRPPGVTWHLARWSPDFPPYACAYSGCLADS